MSQHRNAEQRTNELGAFWRAWHYALLSGAAVGRTIWTRGTWIFVTDYPPRLVAPSEPISPVGGPGPTALVFQVAIPKVVLQHRPNDSFTIWTPTQDDLFAEDWWEIAHERL